MKDERRTTCEKGREDRTACVERRGNKENDRRHRDVHISHTAPRGTHMTSSSHRISIRFVITCTHHTVVPSNFTNNEIFCAYICIISLKPLLNTAVTIGINIYT